VECFRVKIKLGEEHTPLKLEIVQAGEPVLRQLARPLRVDEIGSAEIQQMIADMRETLRLAPGVGLAAPQIGRGVQLAIIEDREQYQSSWSAEQLRVRGRVPVGFHVLINPELEVDDGSQVEFFEGCLSVAGYTAVVPRCRRVRVRSLDERGAEQVIEADGWYSRILQHEIEHLRGTLYIDRMKPRTFMSIKNYLDRWRNAEEEAHCVFGN
jgi:peptide deformylase